MKVAKEKKETKAKTSGYAFDTAFLINQMNFWKEKKDNHKPLPYTLDGLEPVISRDLMFEYQNK